MGLYKNSGYNTNNSDCVWLYDGIIYRYNMIIMGLYKNIRYNNSDDYLFSNNYYWYIYI